MRGNVEHFYRVVFNCVCVCVCVFCKEFNKFINTGAIIWHQYYFEVAFLVYAAICTMGVNRRHFIALLKSILYANASVLFELRSRNFDVIN